MHSTINVYFDYVYPYCFFGEHLISQVADHDTLSIEWMPHDLRPAPQPTLRPDGEYLERVWRDSVYPMAERLGPPIILPRIPPQPHTGLAFEAYQYALSEGQGPGYTHRMFTAFFQEERNIGELSVLTELAKELRFETLDFTHALESGKYRERHRQALRHAQEEMQITAVPTFLKGSHRLEGLPSFSQLRLFLRSIEA